MPNRLGGTASPYLRAHAAQPVDWQPWGAAAFEEAARRQVPVLVSIGYATCHWCHVMARESFDDPVLAAWLNDRFVAVKVDREEYPEVDAAYLAAAQAFTEHLGWPLNVFTDPSGRAFHAGVYWPPAPKGGLPAFRQVLEAVHGAWTERRGEVDALAGSLAEALREAGRLAVDAEAGALPGPEALAAAAAAMIEREDTVHGGFGGAPKFPVAPVLLFLLAQGALPGGAAALATARRTLEAIAASPLRGHDGGFFRYATRADWSEPHYERMLTDNAQLLRAYALLALRLDAIGDAAGADQARETAAGVAGFLLGVLRLPGGFASAQDSESVIDGERVEGGWYLAEPEQRARLQPPALDRKVLTGWTGLAVEALAFAGLRLGRPEWIAAAEEAADELWALHAATPQEDAGAADATAAPGSIALLRSSLDGEASTAAATLEDYGLLAGGLLQLAEATGALRHAVRGRALVHACLAEGAQGFTAPGGGDPVLRRLGVAASPDLSEGALPSGRSAIAAAALRLSRLDGDARLRAAAVAALVPVGAAATAQPVGYGAALEVLTALAAPERQLLVVADRAHPLRVAARGWERPGGTLAVVDAEQAADFAAAGFELYRGRQQEAGYLCEHFLCRLPARTPERLRELLAEPAS